MVSMAQTKRKYHGRKAETYDAVRTKQQRWRLENEAVAKLLPSDLISVLDCPVGTGRFFQLYADRSIECIVGIDASETMLKLAEKKIPSALQKRSRRTGQVKLQLRHGDARMTDLGGESLDAAVCVRFLDLIDQDAMREVLRELCRVARRAVILTIRLGETYIPKVNTATHNRKAFLDLVRKLGWKVEDEVPVFDAGWTVMRLGRK